MRREYPVLMKAILDKNRSLASEVMRNVAREGWRPYLPTICPGNTSAFFLYLARTEGRKAREAAYPFGYPLIDQHGQRHFNGQAKCNVLADFFAAKLSASSDGNSARRTPGTGKQGTSRWRRLNQTGDFLQVLEVEVKKAIAVMAKKKAAGAGGFIARLF